ncbi:MAG: septum site-determining protein MinC [Bacillota bacterium]
MDGNMVTFKGSRNGLYINLAEGPTYEVLLEELNGKLAAARGFFRGSEAVVDVGSRVLTTEQLVVLERRLRTTGGFDLMQVVHEPAEAGDGRRRGADRARVVRRTLHSGQSISHNGNVIVVGDVNPGAEVVAAGDVFILGRLRGIVHAGAGGHHSAVVVAFRMEPIQLRIGEVITRSPAGRQESNLPEVARLQDGVIVVEEYHPSRGSLDGRAVHE